LDEHGFLSPAGGEKSPSSGGTQSQSGLPRVNSQLELDDVQLVSVLKKNCTNTLSTNTFRPCPVGASPTSTRFAVDTELFQGEMLQVSRSSDPVMNGAYHGNMFAGKNRVFVLQVQGRFKRKPRGPICLCLNLLDDTVKLGMLSKRFARMWLSFAQAIITIYGHIE